MNSIIKNYFSKPKSSNSKIAIIAGVAVLTGLAVGFAFPQTRRALARLVSKSTGSKLQNGNNHELAWERDLTHAERLKGPLSKRKDVSKIYVPSAGSSAWKDDYYSE